MGRDVNKSINVVFRSGFRDPLYSVDMDIREREIPAIELSN